MLYITVIIITTTHIINPKRMWRLCFDVNEKDGLRSRQTRLPFVTIYLRTNYTTIF